MYEYVIILVAQFATVFAFGLVLWIGSCGTRDDNVFNDDERSVVYNQIVPL